MFYSESGRLVYSHQGRQDSGESEVRPQTSITPAESSPTIEAPSLSEEISQTTAHGEALLGTLEKMRSFLRKLRSSFS